MIQNVTIQSAIFIGGVTFIECNPNNLTYKLRLKYSPRNLNQSASSLFRTDYDWKTNFVYSLIPILGPREKQDKYGGDPGYYREGFLHIQNQIENLFIKELMPDVDLSERISLERFPYPPYNDDNFVIVVQQIFPFIIMISFVFTVILTAKAIVYEKETGIKEAMKLMGMKTWIYWLSWYIKTFLLLTPAVLFMIISFKVKLTLKSGGKAAIFNHTDPIVLTLFFVLYMSSTITFIFVTSTFFKKANSAAAGAGIIWFLTYLPFIFISLRYEKMNLADKIISAFVNNLGMSESVQLIGFFEGKGVGIQWSNINEGISVDDNFTFLQSLLVNASLTFIHLILLWYLDQVLPGDHGIAKSWNFPFKMLFGSDMEQSSIENPNYQKQENDGFIESESAYESRKIGVRIKGISKTFKQLGKLKTAVNNLSLNIYENHITVLLGHNGAGKSTTISMITGLNKPTTGEITVNNYNIVSETKLARKSLGYCPQHNLLYDDLTVLEHLEFFAKLKENFDRFEIDQLLDNLSLTEKSNSLAKTLSGGMKRKLCVAIALVGGSKIVILDEPSSGMDPQARHLTWSVLQNFKNEKNRTILLCTHYMDEAEVLGDRIAIMSRGSLSCCGSPLFLKSKYGDGYNLVCIKKTNDSTSDNHIINLISKHIPSSKLNSNINTEISFVLPKEEAAKFPELLRDLETNKDNLNIVNIGISVTTVEEVFLKIGDLENVEDDDLIETNDSDKAVIVEQNVTDDSGLLVGSKESDRVTNPFFKYAQQFYALIIKKFIHSLRNKILVISQIIVPIATLLIILLYLKYAPIKPEDSPALTITIEKYRQNNAPYRLLQNSTFLEDLSTFYQLQVNASSNSRAFDLQSNKTVTSCLHARDNIDQFLACIGRLSLNYINDNYIVAATFDGNSIDDLSITAHFNNQPYHVPPLSLNLVTNSLLKSLLNSSKHHITTINHPLPRDINDQITDLQLKGGAGFNIATTLTFGFSFLIASFSSFLIKERVSNAKHIQYLNGANSIIFWLSAFVWDMINYIIPSIISILLIWAFGITEFVGGERVWYTLGLFFFYGLAHIPQTYLMSYLFKVAATGFATIVAWNILASQASLIAVNILQLPQLDLVSEANIIEWVFLTILPNFAFGQALTDLYANYEYNQVCSNYTQFCEIFPNPCCIAFKNISANPCGANDCILWTTNYMAWDKPGLGRFFTFMPIQFLVQFGIVLLLEFGLIRTFFYKLRQAISRNEPNIQDQTQIEALYGDVPKDDDVIAEERRIRELNIKENNEDLLIINNITKYYDRFMAVKGVSIGIKPKECFGLLGVNGAGKTSTFKMITGDEMITRGNVFLNKTSILSEINKYQKQIGYCPQFDPLIDQMTCMETLVMFSRLRAIKEELINKTCHSLINLLDLSDHTYKMCYTLSGGNKRKLSVAISLIGSPILVLLDEPTSVSYSSESLFKLRIY